MAAGGGNEPNLTPFIDLFSVLVCFLLMTAAWLQLESLGTTIDKATASDSADFTPPPPSEKKVQFSVTLEKDKVILKQDNVVTNVVNVQGKMDKRSIKHYLEKWKERFPDRRDVTLNTATGVLYGNLIGMYDLLIESGWPDVGINPE